MSRFALPLLVAALAVPRADAHHSFAAEFSYDESGTITGEVVEVLFVNPHARYFIAIKRRERQGNPLGRADPQPERAGCRRLEQRYDPCRRAAHDRRQPRPRQGAENLDSRGSQGVRRSHTADRRGAAAVSSLPTCRTAARRSRRASARCFCCRALAQQSTLAGDWFLTLNERRAVHTGILTIEATGRGARRLRRRRPGLVRARRRRPSSSNSTRATAAASCSVTRSRTSRGRRARGRADAAARTRRRARGTPNATSCRRPHRRSRSTSPASGRERRRASRA